MRRRVVCWCAIAFVAGACSEQPTAMVPIEAPTSATANAVHYWESNAPVYWNGVARQLVGAYRFNALQAIRGYAIVSLAQYNAAIAA